MPKAAPRGQGHVMTDPEPPPRDPAIAFAPVDPRMPVPATVTVTPPAATGAPRSRRRWVVAALAVAAAAGLAAGLVVWAPWRPPPVLRPAGLTAGSVTANSITLHWSPPPTGPLPDKYLVLSGGTVAGSAAGPATSYRVTGLTPASSYSYRLVAVRGGRRSPASALLTVSTITPPMSQARLQGAWTIYAKNIGAAHGGNNGSLSWQFSPVCTAGACDVVLHGRDGISAITVKLVRSGAVYRGQTVDRGQPCGSGANAIPDPIMLKVRLRVTAAVGFNQAWVANSWTGTMTGTSPYVSAATFYCAAYTFTASLDASPA